MSNNSDCFLIQFASIFSFSSSRTHTVDFLGQPTGVIAHTINITASHANTNRSPHNSSNHGAIANELVVTQQPFLLASIGQNNGEHTANMDNGHSANEGISSNPSQRNAVDDGIVDMSTESVLLMAGGIVTAMPSDLNRITKASAGSFDSNDNDAHGDMSHENDDDNVSAERSNVAVNHIQPADGAGISNTQRNHSPTVSMPAITTNKPRKSCD